MTGLFVGRESIYLPGSRSKRPIQLYRTCMDVAIFKYFSTSEVAHPMALEIADSRASILRYFFLEDHKMRGILYFLCHDKFSINQRSIIIKNKARFPHRTNKTKVVTVGE